jgi:hypothetical protein
MRPERTCSNLEVGDMPQTGRYYARCAVGTAQDRARWADPRREQLLADAAAITAALEARTAPLVDRLWAAKGRQLQATEEQNHLARDRAVAEQQAIVGDCMAEIAAALAQETPRLERLNLPRGTTLEFLRALLDQFVAQTSAENPAIPDEWVERFPEQAWWLLRPRSAAR